MGSAPTATTVPTRVVLTRIPDSWAWMWSDILLRLLPFAAAYVIAYRITGGARWLGLGGGDPGVQLVFAAIASPLMFAAAVAVQLWLTRRRRALSVPADGRDAAFQAAFYAVNGPLEEAFFPGLVQGGMVVAWSTSAGVSVA